MPSAISCRRQPYASLKWNRDWGGGGDEAGGVGWGLEGHAHLESCNRRRHFINMFTYM